MRVVNFVIVWILGFGVLGLGAEIGLEIIGNGSTSENPVFGTSVLVSVTCNGTCPEWVRIDRTDGISNTAPYVSIIDEAVSFEDAPIFPLWLKPCWGPTRIGYGGAPDNRPIPIVASGWTANVNGSRVTGNSSAVTIFYSVAFASVAYSLEVEDVAPGTVRLMLGAPSIPPPVAFDQVRFDRFVSNGVMSPVPEFVTSFSYHQESLGGVLTLAFEEPGIYYYGATPSYMGRAAKCTAGGEYDGRPSTTPMALVVMGPNGTTNNASIPPNFAGEIHHTIALKTDNQFCIIHPNITLFPGCKMYTPLCQPDPSQEIPKQLPFASFLVPIWMDLAGQSNQTSSFPSFINESVPLGNNLKRVTLQSPNARWATYNNYVPVYVAFDASKYTSASIGVFLHASLSEVSNWSEVPWQYLTAELVPRPIVPTPKVSDLMTSITWTDASILLDGELGGQNFSVLETYADLGFNTFPHVSVQGDLTPSSNRPPFAQRDVYPSNRTGSEWSRLEFGPELSGFHGVFSTMLHTPPNASVLASMGVPPSNIPLELQKWTDAVAFHNNTGTIDIAYDGVFFRDDVLQYCNASHLMQSAFIFADDEGWGEGWGAWESNVYVSANAQNRKLPGESDSNLAWRMVREMLASWTACMYPNTTIAFYGTPFPSLVFEQATGIVPQVSLYGPQHYPRALTSIVRAHRLERNTSDTRVYPWITACTYGQMTADQVFSSMLLTYASGATGFSFFIDSCLDNPAKLLALSSSTTLILPFSSLLHQGTPLPYLPTLQNIQAYAGMQLESSLLLVAIPTDPTKSSNITLPLPSTTTYSICNLYTATISPLPSLNLQIPPLPPNTAAAFFIAPQKTINCPTPPKTMWLPKQLRN